MGNKQSCCVYATPKGSQKHEDVYQPAGTPSDYTDQNSTQHYQSSSNLQHISEREPEDNETDPSNNAMVTTLFYTHSKMDVKKNNKMRRRSHYDNHAYFRDYGCMTRKYSSCSTIFIDDSTVSQPNLKNTIKAVALAIYFHIKYRLRVARGFDLDILDEKLHPLAKDAVPDDYDTRDPEHKSIYRFIRTLFNAAQLTAECAIVTLVYLERLITNAEIDLVPANWKRITLGAILLSSKVWDDQAVWNVDYCQILKDIPVEDMNELERQFLEVLQFNINVPSSVYAKYYFDLRSIADAHDLSFPLEPLSKDRALKLEAMSSVCEDKMRLWLKSDIKRSTSLDGLTRSPKISRAILS